MPNEYGIRRGIKCCLKRSRSIQNKGSFKILTESNYDMEQIISVNIEIAKVDSSPIEALIENRDIVNLTKEDEDYSSAKFHQKFENMLNLKVIRVVILLVIMIILANSCRKKLEKEV